MTQLLQVATPATKTRTKKSIREEIKSSDLNLKGGRFTLAVQIVYEGKIPQMKQWIGMRGSSCAIKPMIGGEQYLFTPKSGQLQCLSSSKPGLSGEVVTRLIPMFTEFDE